MSSVVGMKKSYHIWNHTSWFISSVICVTLINNWTDRSEDSQLHITANAVSPKQPMFLFVLVIWFVFKACSLILCVNGWPGLGNCFPRGLQSCQTMHENIFACSLHRSVVQITKQRSSCQWLSFKHKCNATTYCEFKGVMCNCPSVRVFNCVRVQGRDLLSVGVTLPFSSHSKFLSSIFKILCQIIQWGILKKLDQIVLERSARWSCSMFCVLCTVGEVAWL